MGRRALVAVLGVLLAAPAAADAATVSVDDGVLHVVGTAGSERIDLDQVNGGPIYVMNLGRDDALTAGPGCNREPGSPWAVCPSDGVERALIELGDGDDQFLYGRFPLPTRVEGGNGDDELDDTDGVNELYGGEGDDLLWMDAGPDAVPDVLYGGPGYDRASYGQSRGDLVGLRLSLDDVANDGVAGEGDNTHTDIEALNGGSADDVLIGSPDDDELDGWSGNDELYGLGGDDLLGGGEDTDQLHGGAGFDVADYSASWDPVTVSLDGQANDGAAGESDAVGADIEGAFGGYGSDTLTGSKADGLLVGFEGNDRIIDPGGEDLLEGDEGDDQIEAYDGAADEIDCGDDSDRVWKDAADAATGCEVVTTGPRGSEVHPAPTPSPTPTPAAIPKFTPPTRVPVVRPADTTPPFAKVLHIAAQARVATLRRRGFTVTVGCSERCRIRAALKGRHGTVAKGKGTALSGEARQLRLRFTAASRHALRAGVYTLTLTLTDNAGNNSTIVRLLRVK